MNSLLRAALCALVRALAPGAEMSGTPAASASSAGLTATAARTFSEQQYVAPAWEHGHVPLSVDLCGAFGRILDSREPLSAEQLSRIGQMGDNYSALSGRTRAQDSG